jgi:hypothetical protein
LGEATKYPAKLQGCTPESRDKSVQQARFLIRVRRWKIRGCPFSETVLDIGISSSTSRVVEKETCKKGRASDPSICG